jgi:hypothetical protein
MGKSTFCDSTRSNSFGKFGTKNDKSKEMSVDKSVQTLL